jgi:GNAT superfamily N-acetyltransferase
LRVQITEVDLSDEVSFHSWYLVVDEVWQEAWPGEPPWAGEPAMRELFMDRTERHRILFVGRAASGDVVAAAQIELPQLENRHTADVGVSVRPGFRGCGFGRALLQAVEERASSNGRRVLQGSTMGRFASGETRDARFAEAAGYRVARTEVRRDLRLPFDHDRAEALEAASTPKAAGYDVVSWWNRCPDELVESRARLSWTLTADEPRGDLDIEDEQYDVDRIRRWEADIQKVGRELACTGAIDKLTGELAAVTEIGTPRPGDDVAMQFATVVDREHRGHRLGILVKLANLRLLEAHSSSPSRVSTWNAEVNEHMIRVNEELGFEVSGRALNWQKTLS